MDLFSQNNTIKAPLADRMRPANFNDFAGQEHIVGKGKLLRRAIETDMLTSSIFYGPPGCGKTTLAHIVASSTKSSFEMLNAVTSGVADVRKVIGEANNRQRMYGKSTYLLLDECHRWSKAQSDSILPAIEKGIIKFIGSTTENPMIAMTPAIVSRCRIFEFYKLTDAQVKHSLKRAVTDETNGFGKMSIQIDEVAYNHWADVANGDVRSALNALELAVLSTHADKNNVINIDLEIAQDSIQKKLLKVDESYFYDMLSAFCKSLRGSNSDAALAWFARLIYAGVDPKIVVRRLFAHASEDVGLAAPDAMLQVSAAAKALEFVGMPEARLSISQAIIFICEAPKSNSVVMAIGKAFADAEKAAQDPVPNHLRDTHYMGHTKFGRGEGYKYPHDYPDHYVEQEYMPKDNEGKTYYTPSNQGFEDRINAIRKKRNT